MWIHCTKSWSIVDLEHCWYMICYLNKAYGNLSKSRNEIPTWGRPPGLLVIWCMVASHLSCTLIEKFLLYSKRSWIMMDDSQITHTAQHDLVLNYHNLDRPTTCPMSTNSTHWRLSLLGSIKNIFQIISRFLIRPG